jgi:hypothetical protein
MMRQAMLRGFGWRRSAECYARTYRQALAHRAAEVNRGDAVVVARPKRFGDPVTRSAPSAARESPPRGGCASGV